MASHYSVPKNTFLYLLMISMLYASVISLMVILTQYINVLFPDVLNTHPMGYYDTIRVASSILIVVFPTLLLSGWLIQKEMKKFPEVKESRIRKWLLYLTLFIAAITIVIYLIMLFFNFYSGELTLPFLLKLLVVLIISSAVFIYYLMDLNDKIKNRKLVYYVVTAVILGSLIGGFAIVGSPAQQRLVRLDEQRIMDLQSIQWQVVNYWQYKDGMPAELALLNDTLNGFILPMDPETKESYSYRVIDGLKFELCADFDTEMKDTDNHEKYETYGMDNWEHGVGVVCFERTIDPAFYPKP